MNYYKNIVLSYTSQSFIFLQSILNIFIISRIVHPNDYGIYVLLITISGFLNGFIFQPIIQSLLVFGQNNTNYIRVVNGLIKKYFRLILYFLLILFFFAKIIENLKIVYLSLIIAFFLFETIKNYILSLLNIEKNFKKISLINLTSILRPFIIGLSYFLVPTIGSLLFGGIIGTFLILFFTCRKEIDFIINEHSDSSSRLNEILKYSFKIIPSKIIFWFYNAGDKILISYFFGSSTLGLYAPIFNSIFQMVWFIYAALTSFFRPYVYEKSGTKFFTMFFKYFLSLLSFCFIAQLIISSKLFFNLLSFLVGDDYKSLLSMIPVVSKLVLSIILIYGFEIFYLPLKRIKILAFFQTFFIIVWLLYIYCYQNFTLDGLLNQLFIFNISLACLLVIHAILLFLSEKKLKNDKMRKKL